jgi:glycosyltransferase involved in cell wall biosynthesis
MRLAREPETAQRMGAAGRERALSTFSEVRCAQQTDRLYRNALAARGVRYDTI